MGQSVHLQNFLKAEGCSVVAVCDQQGDLARDVAKAYGIPQHFDSVEAMIREARFDAAAAVVLWPLNPALAAQLMAAKKHVFIEKPMASNAKDARQMAECARANGVKLMVAYMKRYDPGVQKAKALIEEAASGGKLGKITYARVHDFVGDWTCGYDPPLVLPKGGGPPPDPKAGVPDFVQEGDRAAYSNLLGVFCHDLNLMRYLLGDPKGVRHSHWAGAMASVTVFDYGGFDCALETGMVPRVPFDEGVRVNFEKGWLRLDVHAPLRLQAPATVTLYREGSIETITPAWGWSFRREAQHFIDCIRQGKETESSGEDGVTDVALAEEMYKAHRGLHG